MEPITTFAIIALFFAGGAAGGYSFGSAGKAERFAELEKRILELSKLIAEQEKIIRNLVKDLEEIRSSRSMFTRFIWFVFKSDPKLYEKFSKLEEELKNRSSATTEQEKTIDQLMKEFPDHPLAKAFEKSA